MKQTAVHYADALYDLARDENCDQEILEDFQAVGELFAQNPGYISLLAAPAVPKKERCQALDEAFRGKIAPYLLNFLQLLCENGEIRQAQSCLQRYRTRYNADHGIVTATVVTAVPLSDALQNKLEEKLRQITGKQIVLRMQIDPEILGGIRINLDGKQLDATVRSRLEGLRKALAQSAL